MSVLQVQRQRILLTNDGNSLAELDGRIYMTINRQPIRVYYTVSFERLDDVIVVMDGQKEILLTKMAACRINHCLYVCNSNKDCILRLTCEGKEVVKGLEARTQVTYCSLTYIDWTSICVLGIDMKLHPAVLPRLSPLDRSLSLQVQLGPIEVLIEMSMTQYWFALTHRKCLCKFLRLIGKAQLHCPGISGNADD